MVRAFQLLVLVAAGGCLVDVTGPIGRGGGEPSAGSSNVGGETSSSAAAGGAAAGGAATGGAAAGGAAAGGAAAGGAATGGAGSGGEATGGGAPVAQHCPSGEFITSILGGEISCGSIDAAATQSLAQSCSVYSGWRDNCGAGCASLPDRYGMASSSACVSPGLDSTCQTHDLGADLGIRLFGLDVDGNVGEGDRFYAAINCLPGSSDDAPCGQGNFVAGYDGSTVQCKPISGAIMNYVRPSCSLVTGWRNACDGCTMPPTKITQASSSTCSVGMGDTCGQAMLGSELVQLASFFTEGDVDGNDKFYVGLRCDNITSEESLSQGSCPQGEFAVGLQADGSLVCRGLAEAAMSAFRGHCSLSYGWKDNCNNCTEPPIKWGRVKDGGCVLSGGQDDTCTTTSIGGQVVHLYGLNTDGGVDGNDKFYIGLDCR